MPDPNDIKEYYQAYLKFQYPEADDYQIQMMMNPKGEYYQYWVNYIWKPAHGFTYDSSAQSFTWKDTAAPEPMPPTPEGTAQEATTPAAPVAPVAFSSALPNQISVGGKFYPVNYVAITDPFDETNEVGGKTGRTISLYAPIVDADNLAPEIMNEIYNNIYAVKDNGEMLYKRALNPEELSGLGVIPYDAVNRTPDLSELTRTMTSTALKKWAKDNGIPLSERDIESYVGQQPETLIGNINQIKKDLQGKISGEPIDSKIPEKMAQFAGAQQVEGQSIYNNEPSRNAFRQKSEYLKSLLDYYEPQYKKYLPSYNQQNEAKTISRDMAEQYGYGAVVKYLEAKKEYDKILNREVPDELIGYANENKAVITNLSNKYNVSGPAYADTALRYMSKIDSPEFAKLSIQEKQDLAVAAGAAGWNAAEGLAEQQRKEQAELKTAQEKQYQELLAKARLSQVNPQRRVSL